MKKYKVKLNGEHYGYIFAKSLKAARSQVLKNHKPTRERTVYVFTKMKKGVDVHSHYLPIFYYFGA